MNIALKTNWAKGEWSAMTLDERKAYWNATVVEVRRDGLLIGRWACLEDAAAVAEHGDTITEYSYMKCPRAPEWVPARTIRHKQSNEVIVNRLDTYAFNNVL